MQNVRVTILPPAALAPPLPAHAHHATMLQQALSWRVRAQYHAARRLLKCGSGSARAQRRNVWCEARVGVRHCTDVAQARVAGAVDLGGADEDRRGSDAGSMPTERGTAQARGVLRVRGGASCHHCHPARSVAGVSAGRYTRTVVTTRDSAARDSAPVRVGGGIGASTPFGLHGRGHWVGQHGSKTVRAPAHHARWHGGHSHGALGPGTQPAVVVPDVPWPWVCTSNVGCALLWSRTAPLCCTDDKAALTAEGTRQALFVTNVGGGVNLALAAAKVHHLADVLCARCVGVAHVGLLNSTGHVACWVCRVACAPQAVAGFAANSPALVAGVSPPPCPCMPLHALALVHPCPCMPPPHIGVQHCGCMRCVRARTSRSRRRGAFAVGSGVGRGHGCDGVLQPQACRREPPLRPRQGNADVSPWPLQALAVASPCLYVVSLLARSRRLAHCPSAPCW